MQNKVQAATGAPATSSSAETSAGPASGALQPQGDAALSRQLASTVMGLHTPPVGTKLYVQSGSIDGKKLFIHYHIDYGGTGTVTQADPDHLFLTVEAVGSYLGESFDRTSELRFSVKDASDLEMSGEIRDDKNRSAKPMKIDDVTLAVEPGSGSDVVKFKDSKKGNEGSLSWDPSTQLLTLRYSAGNIVVLGTTPPKK